MPTWHEQHTETYTTGQRVADAAAGILGKAPTAIAAGDRS